MGVKRMKILAICIPNYNRMEKLERLLREAAGQIIKGNLTRKVQICVSDDCSSENPAELIKTLQGDYPQIEMCFERNEKNRGMDYNFLNSMMMASSEYCWIIGNDDMPTKDGIVTVVSLLEKRVNVDILLTLVDSYSEDGEFDKTVYPLKENEERIFNTFIKQQYSELILSVKHNCGLFGYLSNVVFKRDNWIQYKDLFKDKMNTIFIQMYINIQTLKNGAMFLYEPNKIINHYADDDVNGSIERICKILIGLDGVVEYFFEGVEKEHLKRIIVDEYISGKVWELSDEDVYKKKVIEIKSPKNELYKKYFIPVMKREMFYIDKKFIIYGSGNYGRQVYRELKKYRASIIGVADSFASKIGKCFEEFIIISVSEMAELYRKQDAYVLVANHLELEDMVHTLLENRIERIGIIT